MTRINVQNIFEFIQQMFSKNFCEFFNYLCNYSNKFIDKNFSIFTYIFRIHIKFKNLNIRCVSKIIFKNRVFAKNLHQFIVCEFNKTLKFESNDDFYFEFRIHLISLLNNQLASNRCYSTQIFSNMFRSNQNFHIWKF